MELETVIDIAIGVVTLLGSIATGAGAVWLFFRRRIAAWWAPYRAGINGMAEVPAMAHEIEGLNRAVTMLTLTSRARGDINDNAAEFECDESGANTYVNQTYARWLGVGKNELLGWRYINWVHPEDRERIRVAWESARREHRGYNERHRMITSSGEVLHCETLIVPVPDSPPATAWIGVTRKVVNHG